MTTATEAYIKYQHVEKIATDETDGLLDGECYIFPKLDGTNAQVWFDGEQIRCGSRRREIDVENDNAGFARFIADNPRIGDAVKALRIGTRVFGEWLVPHTLKTYADEAWRDFYVFDVMDPDGDYIHYEHWKQWALEWGINFIPPMVVKKFPTVDMIRDIAEKNDFFMKPGEIGEGVVVKRYGWKNRYGRNVWGKYVRGDFKVKHHIEMGAPVQDGKTPIEYIIAEECVTSALVNKEADKINAAEGRALWSRKSIPRLLQTVYYCVVTESLWGAIKRHKSPTIDFKRLSRAVTDSVRRMSPELF